MALLKNVEPDIIFRHFVWSVLFIASVAYYINTHIMPNIAIYKEQVRFTRVTQMTLEQTRAVNKDAKSRVQSFSNIKTRIIVKTASWFHPMPNCQHTVAQWSICQPIPWAIV